MLEKYLFPIVVQAMKIKPKFSEACNLLDSDGVVHKCSVGKSEDISKLLGLITGCYSSNFTKK